MRGDAHPRRAVRGGARSSDGVPRPAREGASGHGQSLRPRRLEARRRRGRSRGEAHAGEHCVDIAALRAPFAPPRRAARAVNDLAGAWPKLTHCGRRAEERGLSRRGGARQRRRAVRVCPGARRSALAQRGARQPHGQGERRGDPLRRRGRSGSGETRRIASRAWTQLVFEAGFVGDRYEEAARYARLSESAIRRFGGSDALRGDLLDAESRAAYGGGACRSAALRARSPRASRKGVRSVPPRHPRDPLEPRRQPLGRGRRRQGPRDVRTALPRAIALLGETHPGTLRSLLDIAEAKRELGDYDAALTTVKQIRAADRRTRRSSTWRRCACSSRTRSSRSGRSPRGCRRSSRRSR